MKDDRIDCGEPSYRSSDVEAVYEFIAPMCFEIDGDVRCACPALQRETEGGEQKIVDARAICLRCCCKQRCREALVKTGTDLFGRGDEIGPELRLEIDRQFRHRHIRKRTPVRSISIENSRTGQPLQSACEGGPCRCRRRWRHLLVTAVKRLQKDAPGGRVDDQMVRDE